MRRDGIEWLNGGAVSESNPRTNANSIIYSAAGGTLSCGFDLMQPNGRDL